VSRVCWDAKRELDHDVPTLQVGVRVPAVFEAAGQGALYRDRGSEEW
jgi:hypothetical protein